MNRVKFYPINDLAYGYQLRNSEKLIQEYETGKNTNDINDMIELHNVKKYLDNKVYPSSWTPENAQH